jgi:hypothetical protein
MIKSLKNSLHPSNNWDLNLCLAERTNINNSQDLSASPVIEKQYFHELHPQEDLEASFDHPFQPIEETEESFNGEKH